MVQDLRAVNKAKDTHPVVPNPYPCHFLYFQILRIQLVCSVVSNSFATPMDGSPPGSSVQGISQTSVSILVAISFSLGWADSV